MNKILTCYYIYMLCTCRPNFHNTVVTLGIGLLKLAVCLQFVSQKFIILFKILLTTCPTTQFKMKLQTH